MIKFIKSFFGKKEETKVEEAPYKVEQPTQTYESLKPAKVEAPAEAPKVEAVVAPANKPAKKTAAKKTAAKKPKAPKAPKA